MTFIVIYKRYREDRSSASRHAERLPPAQEEMKLLRGDSGRREPRLPSPSSLSALFLLPLRSLCSLFLPLLSLSLSARSLLVSLSLPLAPSPATPSLHPTRTSLSPPSPHTNSLRQAARKDLKW